LQYAVFALGVLLCAGALYLNYRDKRDYAKVHAEAVGRAEPQVEEVQLLVADLSAELNQTAEKIVSDLESKAAQLRGLIDDAKALTVRLEAATGQTTQLREAEAYQPLTVLPWDGRVPTISLVGETESSPKRTQDVATSQSIAAPVAPSNSWREREAAIQEMASRGADVVTIAKELNIGKGEVKLILDLKKASVR
jgi:TolA-binding protein